jgi:hypothetical protein
MGWTFETRKQSKQEFMLELDYDIQRYYNIIEKSVKTKRIWYILQHKQTNEKFIIVYLIDSDKGCWGYKEISEHMSPCYYDCPKNWLQKQPNIPNEYSRDWRKQVLSY